MKRKALFVGVNHYEDPQIRDLDYSLGDAYELKALFGSLGYATDILEDPGRSDVYRTLKSFTSDLSDGDVFLFFFAGHGWTAEGGRHLLFCSDDLYENLRYQDAGIPYDLLVAKTDGGGYHRAFVLDACRSDFMTGARGGDATTRDLVPVGDMVRDASGRGGCAVIRSCSRYEHALEIKSRKHGLFTLALMDVLKATQEEGAGLLFGEGLCDSVAARMSSISLSEGIKAAQTPEFARRGPAVPLVEARGKAAPSVSSTPPIVVCPACGMHNLVTDTFKCKSCGRDHLCRRHYDEAWNCCSDCVAKRREEEAEKRRKEEAKKSRMEEEAVKRQEEDEKRREEAAAAEMQMQMQLAQEKYTRGEDFYYGRNGARQDYAEAVKWYRKAAEQGLAEAQINLGYCYENGQGVPQDCTEAVKWYRKAAEHGLAEAQINLGVCYKYGRGVPQDCTEAVKWYRKAAEQGHANAQCNLGVCYDKGQGVPQDWTEAVKWYRKAAEQGHADAQFNLGVCYYNGRGVPQDRTEAAKWYRLAAEQGNADAQCFLGYCYKNGQGVPQNWTEAVKWYRKAVEQGNASAQCNLGLCYETGQGIPQDVTEAVKWYRQAAEQGNATAQNNLGVCYENGQGVPQDCTKAVKWYRKAAEQGHASAQYNLGYCYEAGKGVLKDITEAMKWFRKAAGQGNENAKRALERLSKEQMGNKGFFKRFFPF